MLACWQILPWLRIYPNKSLKSRPRYRDEVEPKLQNIFDLEFIFLELVGKYAEIYYHKLQIDPTSKIGQHTSKLAEPGQGYSITGTIIRVKIVRNRIVKNRISNPIQPYLKYGEWGLILLIL